MRATTDAVRAWLAAVEDTDISLMDFLERFDSEEQLNNLIESIEQGFICWIAFLDEEYHIANDGWYYDRNEYELDYDGKPIEARYADWCDGWEAYFDSTVDPVCHVNTRHGQRVFSTSYVDHRSDMFAWYEGDVFLEDDLDYFDLVWISDLEEIGHRDYNYYHEGDGCYYSYPEEIWVREYHSYDRRDQKPVKFTDEPKAFVGIEIEKEDIDVKEAQTADNFEYDCEGWVKERDGSLDSDEGFECVSPPIELVPDKIMEYIKSMPALVDIVNADYSSRCGGHIHLSVDGFNGEELFDHIKGYTPLLYALYPRRIDIDFSKAKKNARLKADRQKYQAVQILRDRIEIRIFSAVVNMQNLEWRLKLIELMLKHPTGCPAQAFYNFHAYFMPHIKSVYTDRERLAKLNQRLIKSTIDFEEIEVVIPDFSELAAA